ncbi:MULTISPECIES: AraC family transcriptional regulator [Bradyrhizobium]|jgi:AraC-like DNA-binding protein|uniref:AraC family transcriptional regulator n=1 Tax=Bradyrhizobium TaxID=374 RepID=UPI0009BBF0A4|nr:MULTISPECIES: AraC family transcriptional regulator [Bradyrhizobium]AUC95086.1 AraC family transcriptional regulator [Bradyrhizobium sp. SK17]
MTMQSPDITEFRFSTAQFGERERLPIFREQIGRMMVKLDPEPITDGAFHAEANVRELPGLGIGSWACSNLRIARPRAMLTDGKDDFVLTIITSGQVSASQRGRDIELSPGQAVLMSAAEAGDMATTLSPSRFFGLRLPRKALASLGSAPEDMMMRTLSANSEALRLLAFYVRELDEGYQLATPELAGAVVTHLTDLGALIIGANRDGTVVAEDRGLAAARLAAVKADIRKNLSYGDLTLPAVAARLKLTPRHIQRLFESAGSTFSEFVLGQRLARAYWLLNDPSRTTSTIGTIAFEVGFGDLSYFNRTFRRHYGATPSEIRAVPRRA